MSSPRLPSSLQAAAVVRILEEAGLLLDSHMPDPERLFAAYTTDSRRVTADQLFIAYQGVKTDAHQHLEKLFATHPQFGFIYEQDHYAPLAKRAAFACRVRDSREAWAQLAAYRWGRPQTKLKLLGVTGTNGKTSTVWFLRQILQKLGQSCLTIGTLGVYCGEEKLPASHTTPDPDALFQYLAMAVDRGLRWVAMELSSHAVVQKRLGPLRFDAIAFTSFSRDHLDFHGTMEAYFAAKWQLIQDFRRPGAPAWLSSSLGSWRPVEASSSTLCFTYGPEGESALPLTLSYSIQSMKLAESRFSIRLRGGEDGAEEVWTGALPFGGDFAVENFAAALALVHSVLGRGLPSELWAAIAPVPGRFEPIVAKGLAVIVDYAHTPDALEKTLLKLRELTRGKVWVVFGCGGDRDRGKRPLMGALAENGADVVILTSDNPRSEDPEGILNEIAAGLRAPERALRISDRAQAIGYAIEKAAVDDAILVAGKGHEDYQLIGSQVLPFDDKKVAAAFLAKRS